MGRVVEQYFHKKFQLFHRQIFTYWNTHPQVENPDIRDTDWDELEKGDSSSLY